MINLLEPYEVLNNQWINASSYKYGLPPFPRSTFLMEDEDGTQVMYMVDRNYMFMKYDINNYTEKQLTHQYSYPLNTSFLNDSCSDLQRVSQYTDNYTIMFCQTITFKVDPGTNQTVRSVMTTIVRMENLMNGGYPIARYLSYNMTQVVIDTNVQLTNMGCEFKLLSTQQVCLYLGVAYIQSRQKQGPVIFKINITEFEDMRLNGETYRVLTDREPVSAKYWIVVPDVLTGLPVTDVELLGISYYSQDYPWLAVLVESKHIAFCQYSYFSVIWTSADNQNLPCINGTVIDYQNMGSMYHNDKDKSNFYASLISPPGVVEIRVDDPTNAYINRVYKVQEDEYHRYIGQPVIATNDIYILHLMVDMLTSQQVIRVYDRQSNYYSTALFDYKLRKESKTNYYIFPSMFLDIIFYRDEDIVSLVRMSQYRLVLDATNSTLVRDVIAHGDNEVFINLTADNGHGQVIYTMFNVTFVDKDDTQIYSVSKDRIDQKVLYNCGDNRFSFAINGYFNGPNYELSPVDVEGSKACDDGQCFFNFTRKDLFQQFNATFNFSECQDSYSLPAVEDDKWHNHGDLVLICINKVTSEISTYSYDAENNNLTQTNIISMPQTQFMSGSIDMDMRRLILFTNSTNSQIDSSAWISAQMVVHIFAIQNSVIWKANTTISQGLMSTNNIAGMSYNTHAKRGVLVSEVEIDLDTGEASQMLSVFDVSSTYPFVQERTSLYFAVTVDDPEKNLTTKIIRTDISQEGFIYALQENNKMVVYEAVDYYSFFNLSHTIVKRWEQTFIELSEGQQIHDFDILEGSYIVLYTGDNETLIYQIEMQIYWTYKMVLPLFKEYANYKYFSSTVSENQFIPQRIIRSSAGEYVAILMANDDSQDRRFSIFFYCFTTSQHDSLVLIQNVTDFFEPTQYQNLYLIGDGDGDALEVTLMSDLKLSLNNIRVRSSIVVTTDREQLSELIDACSLLSIQVDDQGVVQDLGGRISQLLIAPKSRFVIDTEQTTVQDVERFINLTIITQNQGLIAMPSQSPKVHFAYSGDQDEASYETQNSIFMQEIVDGYNLTYNFTCTFYDDDGFLRDCDVHGSLTDETKNEPYTFWIEQVTSNNRVVRSFTMNRLFFMLDSKHNINILSLHNNDLNLDEINLYALDSLKTFSQKDKLGCNVSEYAEHVELYQEDGYIVYLLMYQCVVNNKITLKMATMTVYNITGDPSLDDANITNCITQLNGQLDIAVPILDIEIYDYNSTEKQFNMIITTRINGSYQNIIFFVNAVIGEDNKTVTFLKDSQHYMSAVSTNRNTFKVTQVLIFPVFQSHLALLAMEDTGALIIDTESKTVLAEYNILELNPFPEQAEQQQGQLQVFSLVGDWPYSFHILSNYGLYVFTFGVNLTDRNSWILTHDQALRPIQSRVIQLYFDKFNYQLATNSYGYAFLVTKNTSVSNYDVYLGGVSFNALENSKILRMIKIAPNQQCISLNAEPYLASSEEDQIAVSFICDTQLFIVRLCMKPHLVTDMSLFDKLATRRSTSGELKPGILQFGQFNITVNATNEYTNPDRNKGLIHIKLEYQAEQTSSQIVFTMIYFTIIVLLMVTFLSLVYLTYRQQELRLKSKIMKEMTETYNNRNSRYSRRTVRTVRSQSMRSQRPSGGQSEYSRRLPTQSEDELMGPHNKTPSLRQMDYLVPSDVEVSPVRQQFSPPVASPVGKIQLANTAEAEEMRRKKADLYGLQEKLRDSRKRTVTSNDTKLLDLSKFEKKSSRQTGTSKDSKEIQQDSFRFSKVSSQKQSAIEEPRGRLFNSQRSNNCRLHTYALNDSGMASTVRNSGDQIFQSPQNNTDDESNMQLFYSERGSQAEKKMTKIQQLQYDLQKSQSQALAIKNKEALQNDMDRERFQCLRTTTGKVQRILQ